MRLYEILIPVNYNDGTPIPEYLRQEWIRNATALAGGSTVLPEVQGKWYQNDFLYAEPMTPVRIALADGFSLGTLIEDAKRWFHQEVIMYYVLSTEVHFV